MHWETFEAPGAPESFGCGKGTAPHVGVGPWLGFLREFPLNAVNNQLHADNPRSGAAVGALPSN